MARVRDGDYRDSEEVLLMVSWGKETLQPLQYHSIEIGPYQMSKEVRRCDMVAAAEEMYEEMERIADAAFEKKVRNFLERTRRLNSMVRGKQRG